MIPRSKEELTTTAEQFVEHYGITPRYFVSQCLLPSLLAVRTVSFSYRGVLVETRQFPSWKPRLRALRTVFAMSAADEVREKHIKIPFGALRPEQLAIIADGFRETDWRWITAEFLIKDCLKPALDAVNVAHLFYQGLLVDSHRTADWGTKLEALKIVARVHKLYANEYDNIHFATHRDIALLVSKARQASRTIEIVRRTQLVYLR